MILISKTYWLGMPFNYLGDLPDGVIPEAVTTKAQDMREIGGSYYAPKDRAKVAVLAMHPKVDFRRHYFIPPFLEAGYACLGMNTRCINNDTTCIHEDILLDVAAAVKYLKEVKGHEKVILFGNSGGGSLSAMYQQQALLEKGQRISHEPSGKPTKLNDVELIPADAFISVSAHIGEGRILMDCIDPSVIDENDPLSVNPELDMYDIRNGFAPPPEQSRYPEEFVKKYRAAQEERVKRLDELAHSYIQDAREHEKKYKESKGSLDFMERHHIGRRAALERVMVIYRTMANLNYCDHSLDPSSRGYGSLLSDRPDLMNYQYNGFARMVTPEAWLSTWSGISSNADLEKTIAGITQPVLVVNALKDKEIFPKSDAEKIWSAVTSEDKTYLTIEAEHYFEPEFGAKEAPDVAKLMQKVIPWVNERFGS